MLHELALTTYVLQTREAHLSDDGAKLSAGSRETVCSAPVSCREHPSWNNEGRRVGAEVLEEVGEAVEGDEPV